MRISICLSVVLICAPVALGQAITGFTGGIEYDSYYGGSAGDVVGFRFTVSNDFEVTDLGIWNADNTGGIESPHQVGIWDGCQALIASVTVDGTGTVVGDWIYASITPVTIGPGQTYTIGALYFSGDSDWYISGASSVTADPDVTWISSVYPTNGEQGFVYPELESTSFGRFGPNFLFGPVSLEQTTWGAIKASLL